MYNNKKILAIIPARGGSKGIPKKNIIDMNGKPLINYTIEAAIASEWLTDCIVSTDSKDISDIALNAGVDVPFLRPSNLSNDTALSFPVIQHALEYMERDDNMYDAVVMLQPTTPLRITEDIDNALNLLFDTDADSVISVVDVDAHHPLRMKRIVDGKLINYIDQGYEDMRPRQKLPQVYIRNGAIYATTRQSLLESSSLSGSNCRAYVMPYERSINIDTIHDLELAKQYSRCK